MRRQVQIKSRRGGPHERSICTTGVAVARRCIAARDLCSTAQSAQQKFVTIGTGGVTGVYYAVGGAICRLVNKDRAKTGLRCSVESTGGSVFNVNAIKSGELDFGLAQSDVQYQRRPRATGQFKGKPMSDLRAVFSVHPEPFTVAGAQGSGRHASSPTSRASASTSAIRAPARCSSMEELLDADGLEDHGLLARRRAQGRRAGHGAVRQQDRRLLLRRRSSVRRHPGSDDRVRRKADLAHRPGRRCAGQGASVLRRTPRFPGGMYANNPNPTQTYGVLATMVTSSKVPDRRRLRAGQGGVREFRRVQEAASGVCQPRSAADDQGRPLGAAA